MYNTRLCEPTFPAGKRSPLGLDLSSACCLLVALGTKHKHQGAPQKNEEIDVHLPQHKTKGSYVLYFVLLFCFYCFLLFFNRVVGHFVTRGGLKTRFF
jgi:hypothetical protein